MKSTRAACRRLLQAMLLFTFIICLSITANAAGKVKIISAVTTETTVKLTWQKVSNIKGYRIYAVDENGRKARVAKVSKKKTSYKIKGLTTNQTYRFYMTAYDRKGEGKKSKVIKVTPRIRGLEQVLNLAVGSQDGALQLLWTKNAHAEGYVIYQLNDAGEYEIVAHTKKRKYTFSGLTNGEKYTYKVATYKTIDGTKVIGVPSSAVSGTPMDDSAISGIHMYYFTATMQSDYSTDGVTFKEGSVVTVMSVTDGYADVLYKKHRYSVPVSRLEIDGYKTNYKKAYSKSTAVTYVNYSGFSSRTGYFIWVSTYCQRVYVFKGSKYRWKLVKSFLCSTGMYQDDQGKGVSTPKGRGVTGPTRYEWWWAGDQVCYYCVDMIPGGFFHSWLYHPDGSLYPGVGKLGVPSSHGCVRSKLSDAKWLYNHIPKGTSYIVF